MTNDVSKSYVPPPKGGLPGFPDAKKGKKKSHRQRWINGDGDILEWDYEHGKIERYDPRGKHKGEYEHDTGKQTKPAKPGRTVTPTIKGREHMYFYLGRYGKETDEVFEETYLPSATADDVRKAFGLKPADYPGDCLLVGKEHLEWLKTQTHVTIDLDRFEYMVEVFSNAPNP